MKFRYDKEDDILMIWLSNKKVGHAVQSKNVITHFSSDGEAVLLEILNASKFLKNISQVFPRKVRQQLLSA